MVGAEGRAPAELEVGGRWQVGARPLTPARFGLLTGTKGPPSHRGQAALRTQRVG